MDEKTPPVDQPATRTEGEGKTLEMPEGFESFTPGQVLGDRYQILEMLGRGGMGEVWHAFDLKLRVEVALKALREDLFKSERRLELLRQEVRAAREVVSPNVCRIFDLIEVEGRELVSMEYIDGATLLGVLQERGPLELKEAQDIASQFLAGLEAIHKVGLIHRDIKPENIMLTRAGRVVVMDFGLARQETEGGGTVSGTPAYMAPEQAAGQTVDARADVYAAGVVLAEMVSPEGIKSYESRQSLWEGVRSEPAKLPDSPWAPAIKKAVAKDREQRYHTAHTLTRALEDVTLRVEGAEDLHPYPGLASFTEDDAEYFFGREAEVEQMWRKLGRPHLLGIVGPSGAGKTSFIRAGVIPNAGSGWAIATCNPGNAAFLSLGRALIPELSGDTDAMEALLQPEDLDRMVSAVTSWRGQHEQALLIVDQFEELFTQNPAETQARFAELLGRLVLEVDVFVLLSMRDDFFFHCHQFEALKPVVTDLTLLGPPAGAALRRAMVQPAMKCGYRFEDDDLVEEMLADVEGERGALPLLAFAAARLWEKRDRETGLLTRQAYHDIGGVGGALARHAEATIDHIGTDRIALVRELFRNLVTAEGTRAVREWNELLSIFSDSRSESQPEEVLRQLIDARLLTSYEIRNEDEAPTRSVEIIHESLLANWPRLVRWQTQDADSAQLRDQLRQTAQTWEKRGRSDEMLWTGSVYREFASWRERYPGGLSDVEERFSHAMEALAGRRRRRRRIAFASVLAAAIVVATALGGLWRRSVMETRRAESQKLIALGQLELEDYPTAALTYARTSLEVFDTPEARRLALEALYEGAAARIPEPGSTYWNVDMSPDGKWLALSGPGQDVLLLDHNGGPPRVFGDHAKTARPRQVDFGPRSDVLFSKLMGSHKETFVSYSVPDGEKLQTVELENIYTEAEVRGDSYFTLSWVSWNPPRAELRRWPTPGGEPTLVGDVSLSSDPETNWDVDAQGKWFVYRRGNTVRARPLEDFRAATEHMVCELDHRNFGVRFHPHGDRVWTYSKTNDEPVIHLWSLHGGDDRPLRSFRGLRSGRWGWPICDPAGTKLAHTSADLRAAYVYDLGAWPGAEPLRYRRSDADLRYLDFSPDSSWLVTAGHETTTVWWLGFPRPLVLPGHHVAMDGLVFTPDSRWLASRGRDGARLWPMSAEAGHAQRLLKEGNCYGVAPDPKSERWIWAGPTGPVLILSSDGGTATELMGSLWGDPRGEAAMGAVAFDSTGRLAAASPNYAPNPEALLLRIWDLESGDLRTFPQWSGADRSGPYDGGIQTLRFSPDGSLYSAGIGDVRRWDIVDGSHEIIIKAEISRMDLNPDGRLLVAVTSPFGENPPYVPSALTVVDLQTDKARAINAHGNRLHSVAIDSSGTVIATGDYDGNLRVGAVTGEAPHLLLGHDGAVTSVAFSPDGHWIASASSNELLLWPMPDLSKPPIHTLPHDELLSKLETFTNLDVIRDEDSPIGWKVEIGPFPGWAEVPEW